MKKIIQFLICLTAVILLTCLGAACALAQEKNLNYGSFDSFDPSDDFKQTESRPPSTPPAPVEYERPAADGMASGGMDIPDRGDHEASLPAADSRPAPSGFDFSEPGASEATEPRAAVESAPSARHSGFDLTDPREAENLPPAVEDPQPTSPAQAVETAQAVQAPAPPPVTLSEAINYGQPENWLSLPDAPDNSVDVFFLYTGSCFRVGQGGAVCSPNDPGMRQKAQESLRQQAAVFAPIANIYAPYYRQANSNIFLGLGEEDRAQRLAVSTADAMAAFDRYLKHHNKGRPFILAAHGQGSAAMLNGILSDYFRANPEIRSRMVAAYVLGYSVTSDYLSANNHLRFAQRRNDTGVIISYNTEAPGLTASNPTVLPRAVAINPINWARSEIPARADSSLGSNLSAFGGEEQVEKYADARVLLRRGVVECSTVDPDEYPTDFFPWGAYPGGDYAFYFYDLRANAQERVGAFMQTRGQ